MQKLIRRIDGLIRIAHKRQENENEQDKLIGRQVERNLKMVKKIIGEKITWCANCKYRMEFEEAMEENLVSPTEASEMYAEDAECVCGLLVIGMKNSGYCSFGEKIKPEGER